MVPNRPTVRRLRVTAALGHGVVRRRDVTVVPQHHRMEPVGTAAGIRGPGVGPVLGYSCQTGAVVAPSGARVTGTLRCGRALWLARLAKEG